MLKNTSHQLLRMVQDGRDAAQEDSAHYANTFLISLLEKDLFFIPISVPDTSLCYSGCNSNI